MATGRRAAAGAAWSPARGRSEVLGPTTSRALLEPRRGRDRRAAAAGSRSPAGTGVDGVPGVDRQGPLHGRAGAGDRRRPARAADRRAARGDRLRHALGARAGADHGRPTRCAAWPAASSRPAAWARRSSRRSASSRRGRGARGDHRGRPRSLAARRRARTARGSCPTREAWCRHELGRARRARTATSTACG